MKIIIEREELEKLLSLYVKNKLKCEIDLTDAILSDGKDIQMYLSNITEIRVSIKIEDK